MSIEDLISRDLRIARERVKQLATDPSSYYYVFPLGERKIHAPRSELKFIQSWIHDFLVAGSKSLPGFVTAYEKKTGICKNAEAHRNRRHLLCLDIKSFFNHCRTDHVEKVFSGMVLDEPLPNGKRTLCKEDVDLLTSLSVLDGSLSVGAPSSPALANRIMLPIDYRIIAELGQGYVYTRYSDDISVSSNTWIDEERVIGIVGEVLAEDGFSLNESKTRCYGRGNARRVTGVFLTPEGCLSIGSKRKREVNKRLYDYLVHGKGKPEELLGFLNFCMSVEPQYVNRLLAKYANYGLAAECDGVIDAIRQRL